VRKAVDDVVRIVITRAAVPVVGARVGRKLHQPERRGRSWKRVPVSARADERVDVTRVVAGLRGNGEQRAVSREQYEDAKAKDVFMYVHLWSILTLVLLFLIHSPVVYGGVTQYVNQPARFNGLTMAKSAIRTLKRPFIFIAMLPRRKRRGYTKAVRNPIAALLDHPAQNLARPFIDKYQICSFCGQLKSDARFGG